MAKRVSKKVVEGITAEEFNDALGNYASADARINTINAKMDEKFTKIREEYASELKELTESQQQDFEIMQTYCTEQKDVLFANQRTIETVHGTVGFRTTPPALKNRKGFTWAAVLELVKVKLPTYVRTKEELDKESLLAARNTDEVSKLFPSIGVEVVQSETFGVTLKKEESKES